MPRFGQLEEQVMLRVWAADHPLQVREVREALLPDRELAHTTVMTVLDKLFRKGWLQRETAGRAYRYSPVMSRESYTAALMHEAWSAAENPAAALVHFIESMNTDQRDALRDALRVVLPAYAGRREGHPDPLATSGRPGAAPSMRILRHHGRGPRDKPAGQPPHGEPHAGP